jgi:hypothetical protein
MFKEKIKIWHDMRIQKKEFKQGDQVLLFNSRFKFSAGKLISNGVDHMRYKKFIARDL